MTKTIVFDSSSIISLTTNNLLWTLKPLKKLFNGKFQIPKAVRHELIDTPLHSKKFKLEAMRANQIIKEGTLEVAEHLEVDKLTNDINSIFTAKGKTIRIVSEGEVEAMVLAKEKNAGAYVVDERTMRLLIEFPERMHKVLQSKLHTKVTINRNLMKQLKTYTKGIKVIRSSELMMVAFEKGILKDMMADNNKNEFVDALLWGLRLRGCGISTNEIETLKRLA